MTNAYLTEIEGVDRDTIIAACYAANGDISDFFWNITHDFSKNFYLDEFNAKIGDKKFTTIKDSDYPEKLKTLDCPPPVIVYRGDLSALDNLDFYCDHKLPDDLDENQMLFYDTFNKTVHIGKKLTVYNCNSWGDGRKVLLSFLPLCNKAVFHSWRHPKLPSQFLTDFIFSNGKCLVLVDLSLGLVNELRPVDHGKITYRLLPPSFDFSL